MYWWHLINSDENSLIKRCYKAQKNNPARKDWIHEIENDKKEFDFNLSDEELKAISKNKFRKLLKNAGINIEMKYLKKVKINILKWMI
jgi:hypothetical protein